jgi:hypothetical protein
MIQDSPSSFSALVLKKKKTVKDRVSVRVSIEEKEKASYRRNNDPQS